MIEWSCKVKHSLSLVVSAGCLSACSSSHLIHSITHGEMNKLFDGRQVDIKLVDGKQVRAKGVHVAGDSVSWVDARTDQESKENLGQCNRLVIVEKGHGLGALEGLGLGVVGGGSLGFLYGVEVSESKNEAGLNGFGVALVYGAPIGAGIGFIVGMAVGHSYEYEILLKEEDGRKTRIERSTTEIRALHLKNGTIEQSLNDYDAIHLKNGNLVRGTIIGEVGSGEYLVRVTIRKWDGEVRTFEASEIERISRQIK